MRPDQGVRVHRVQAARDADGKRAAMPDEEAEQDDVRSVGAHGKDAGDREAPRRPRHLGQQRHWSHEQHAARRLHHGEVTIRDRSAYKAQRVAEQDAIVVFRHAEQVAGPAELVDAEGKGHRRARGHRQRRRRLASAEGKADGSAQRRAGQATTVHGRRLYAPADALFMDLP